MKTAIACALALGMVGAAAGVRAEGPDCCLGQASKKQGCCAAGEAGGKICLVARGITAAEAAKRLGQAIGAEVRLQGPSFGLVDLKLCAPTPEAAMAEAARAMNARWRPAFIFGAGSAADKTTVADRGITVAFRNAPAASAAFVAAARVGGVLIVDKPLTGKVTFQGKNVTAGTVMDVIATAAGVNWKPAYVLQIGPDVLAKRVLDPNNVGAKGQLKLRPDSPLTHLHHGSGGPHGVAPAPGMIVKDPAAENARLEQEAMRRAQLGEWAGVFTQETPKDIRRAIRDLRIRVETAIQKLESYPPQNRHLGAGMWHARYLRMMEDYKSLTPEQQKQVQPVLDVMKYFAESPEPKS